jgi:chromosome segregation ATPase
MLKRLLQRLPIVTARRLRVTTSQLEECRRRVAELKRLLETAREEARSWKAKADEAQKRALDFRTQLEPTAHKVHALRHELEKAQGEHRKAQRELEKAQHRHQSDMTGAGEEIDALRARIAAMSQDLEIAREYLLLVDVKLDILEGAANVLDLRLRAAVAGASSANEALHMSRRA